MSTNMIGYVYMMYDNLECSGNPIYIGKTKCARSRIHGHFSTLHNGKMDEDLYRQVRGIKYLKCNTYADASILERYYIGIYQPVGNTQYTQEGAVTIKIDMEGFHWEYLDAESIEHLRTHQPIERKGNTLDIDKMLKKCILIVRTEHTYQLYFLGQKPVELIQCRTTLEVKQYKHSFPIFWISKEQERKILNAQDRIPNADERINIKNDKAYKKELAKFVLPIVDKRKSLRDAIMKNGGKMSIEMLPSHERQKLNNILRTCHDEEYGCNIAALLSPEEDTSVFVYGAERLRIKEEVRRYSQMLMAS